VKKKSAMRKLLDFINERLKNGKGTGAIQHPTPDNIGRLEVRRGARGRGLFAVTCAGG
jgi:hypothetical protein